MTIPLLPGIVGVVVPKGAKDFSIVYGQSAGTHKGRMIRCWVRPFGHHKYFSLPPGNYELIGLGSELTEDQAAAIVESRYNGYADYESDGYFGMDRYGNYHSFPALVSFSSLLRSLNLDPATTVILRSRPAGNKIVNKVK